MSKVSYSSAIGSLMYYTVCTKPDIAHAVGVVSRYISIQVSSIGKVTSDTSLCFIGAYLKLQCYVDADLAGGVDSRKVLLDLCILWVVLLCVGIQGHRILLLFPQQKLNMKP